MLNWFNDNLYLFGIFLGFVLIVLVAIWWRNRKGMFLVASLVVLLLIGLVYLADYLIYSDTEQINDNLQAMALAVENGDSQTIAKHLATTFEFHSHGVTVNKENAVRMIDSAVQLNRLKSVYLWDVYIDPLDSAKGTAKVEFRARPEVDDKEPPVRCESDFIRESGQWRMQTFKAFWPVGDQEIPIRVN